MLSHKDESRKRKRLLRGRSESRQYFQKEQASAEISNKKINKMEENIEIILNIIQTIKLS